jgi:hypothetical protein|nr:MAG TPA: Hint [Caudoviricetes sp.]
MENKIKAEIIAHSKRINTGDEIITYKLTFPRIILSEINTYKMLEKNTSSCISGDCKILTYYEKGKKFIEYEIRELYKFYINGDKDLKIVSFNEKNFFLLQDIKEVIYSGAKPVYKIVFDNDSTLVCTEDHKLFSISGKYKTLKDFNLQNNEDGLLINVDILTRYFVSISKEFKLFDFKVDNINLIYSNTDKFVQLYDLSDNVKVSRIEYLGIRETYDIEVDGEYHNFIADNIVVHNSRAIPFEKMVKVVEKEPFIPIAWQLSHKGMQGDKYITDPYVIEKKKEYWLNARGKAINSASSLVSSEISNVEYKQNEDDSLKEKSISLISNSTVTKQIANRLLEPFMWTTQLITGTRESFEHLFEQRCPIYELDVHFVSPDGLIVPSTITSKSKKDAIKFTKENSVLNDFSNKDNLWWLQHNKGQAEIHFMDLAEKMYDTLNESTPDELFEDEWHIPFKEEILFKNNNINLEDIIKISCAMTARISYTAIEGDKVPDYETALRIYNKCKEQGHFSVFGHIAKCMTNEEYESWIKGKIYEDSSDYRTVIPEESKGYNKNLKGFISLRQYVEDGVELKDI